MTRDNGNLFAPLCSGIPKSKVYKSNINITGAAQVMVTKMPKIFLSSDA
jgi:hypothetical protein